jgi:hypothetical protein
MSMPVNQSCVLKIWMIGVFLPFIYVSSQATSFSEVRFKETINKNIQALQEVAAESPGPFDLGVSNEEVGRMVLTSGVRGSAFSLQSLALLYENYPDVQVRALVKRIKDKAKEIEDLVGNYDKFLVSNAEAEAIAAADDLAKGLFGLGTKEQGFINKKSETPELTEIFERVKKAKWLPAKKDRAYVLGALTELLEGVQTKKYYKMKVLEAGLHEFRRDLRWFGMSAAALGGLVQTSDGDLNQCEGLHGNLSDPSTARRKSCGLFSC